MPLCWSLGGVKVLVTPSQQQVLGCLWEAFQGFPGLLMQLCWFFELALVPGLFNVDSGTGPGLDGTWVVNLPGSCLSESELHRNLMEATAGLTARPLFPPLAGHPDEMEWMRNSTAYALLKHCP